MLYIPIRDLKGPIYVRRFHQNNMTLQVLQSFIVGWVHDSNTCYVNLCFIDCGGGNICGKYMCK